MTDQIWRHFRQTHPQAFSLESNALCDANAGMDQAVQRARNEAATGRDHGGFFVAVFEKVRRDDGDAASDDDDGDAATHWSGLLQDGKGQVSVAVQHRRFYAILAWRSDYLCSDPAA